jgi:hypothetical protein
MTEQNKQPQEQQDNTKPNEYSPMVFTGHLKIHDPETKEVLLDKRNAIHYENMSEALAKSFANRGTGTAYQMVFGNGGTTVDTTGVITYLTPNSKGSNASLYNQTYAKVVDDQSAANLDATRNKLEVRHTAGNTYSDILITCLLDYGEPSGQDAFDTSTTMSGDYVFDELGIKSFESSSDSSLNKLLTHVIFHPVQKSLNRLIQIDYTIRIQSLTSFNEPANTTGIGSTSSTTTGTTTTTVVSSGGYY